MNNCYKTFKKWIILPSSAGITDRRTAHTHLISHFISRSHSKLQSWPMQGLIRTQHGTWLGTLKA